MGENLMKSEVGEQATERTLDGDRLASYVTPLT